MSCSGQGGGLCCFLTVKSLHHVLRRMQAGGDGQPSCGRHLRHTLYRGAGTHSRTAITVANRIWAVLQQGTPARVQLRWQRQPVTPRWLCFQAPWSPFPCGSCTELQQYLGNPRSPGQLPGWQCSKVGSSGYQAAPCQPGGRLNPMPAL